MQNRICNIPDAWKKIIIIAQNKNCHLHTTICILIQLEVICMLRSPLLFLILRINKETGSSKTVTLILFQTSDLVGSWAIFSAISMSSGRTEPNTVYACFHSWWFARLMKNSGPEPIHATEPLLIIGHSSVGIFLNIIPWGSSVPWISPKGGPKGAWEIHKTRLSYKL